MAAKASVAEKLGVKIGRSTSPSEHQSELDSHADTGCVGDGVVILAIHEDRKVDLTPFLTTLGTITAHIVTAAVVYDDPKTGNAILLIFHQVIHVPGLKNNLLCPMQLRHAGIVVNERPKHCTDDPTEDDHALILPDDTRIVLQLDGVTSFFPTRTPTEEELSAYPSNGHYVEMTANFPEWDPQSERFQILESRLVDEDGDLIDRELPRNRRVFSVLTSRSLDDPFRTLRLRGGENGTSKVAATKSVRWQDNANVEQLARTWRIGLPAAERTLKASTQRGVREYDGKTGSVERRYPTGDRHLRYKRLMHPLYHDTLFSTVKSTRLNAVSHLYATDFGWSRNFPCKTKGDAHHTLDDLFHRYGVPTRLISDGAKELTQGEFARKARQAQCPIDLVDKYSQFQDSAEAEIREVKRLANRWQTSTNSPRRLWDYCVVLASLVRSHTALPMYQLHGQLPESVMTGQTADISHICEFGWYWWVYYNDPPGTFPEGKWHLGRYLGPTDPGKGSVMSYWILPISANPITRTTVRRLTPQELESRDIQRQMDDFTRIIEEKIGKDTEKPIKVPAKAETATVGISMIDVSDVQTPVYERYEDDEEKTEAIPEPDDFEPEGYDAYVTSRVALPRGDRPEIATVLKRKRNAEGVPIGRSNGNPMLDTSVYEVQFEDGQVLEYSANVIAENLYSQVDEEGHHQVMMEEISDHRSDATAVKRSEGTFTLNGKTHKKLTTRGWELCVTWKDGSSSWEKLSDLKEAYPVLVAEYASLHDLLKEPAFAWWAPSVLRRRDRIVASVNKRYHKRTHKFGIELPKSIKQALEIDRRTGTTYWRDALDKEIGEVRVAFEVLEDDENLPSNYQQIRCHVVFDIKMGTLQRKARLVAGGHTTETPASITYASVVSRESVRIALTIAALNDLEVIAADIKNAYLSSPCEEKIWTVLGPEFGPELSGKRAKIVRSLYGLRSAGAAYRHHLATCMQHLGYKSCLADPDVWLRPNSKPDGTEIYEYVLIYTDDILVIGIDPKTTLTRLGKYFTLKDGSVGPPDIYLGAKLRSTPLDNGKKCWTQSSSAYVKEAVRNTEEWLDARDMRLPTRADTPMPSTYRPELDTSPQLNDEMANWYQSAIGVLRWAVEIGRIDITGEVSILASHMALPRQGHLVAVLRVFAYLKHHHNSRLAFDPSYPTIDHTSFPTNDWGRFYGDVKETIPPNAPAPRGLPVVLRTFVDADHAADKMTRRSRTGFIMFVNSAPIIWYSKKQGGVEGASFGSEFMAMKTAAEVNRGLRYKLRMMGIPIDGPTYTYGDNMSVLHNTQKPESMLKKKSNSIAYHLVREAVAMGEMLTGYINTDDNVSDILTKALPRGERRERLVRKVMWDIYSV